MKPMTPITELPISTQLQTNRGGFPMLGWFVGECTNTTSGGSANLLLTLYGATASTLYGELDLSGELQGGGPFHGTTNGDTIVFTTCRPALQLVIEWRGTISGQQLSGTYSATCEHPKVKPERRQQAGVWSCAFVRAPGNADGMNSNSVWVYDGGRSEGPLTNEEFTRHLTADRWPLQAIVALDDRTSWATVGDHVARLEAQIVSEN